MGDVYLSVRLEAGTLHLAKYLILATFYFLATKLAIILLITKLSCPLSGIIAFNLRISFLFGKRF